MSRLSRESDLAQLREGLAQLNSELFLTIRERRSLTVRVQELKGPQGRYAHYDPDREKEIFTHFQTELRGLSLKELLAFSLIMEDQAMAMAPGSYPAWSSGAHVVNPEKELFQMMNPLMLKMSRPDFFNRLKLSPEFSFLKDF